LDYLRIGDEELFEALLPAEEEENAVAGSVLIFRTSRAQIFVEVLKEVLVLESFE